MRCCNALLVRFSLVFFYYGCILAVVQIQFLVPIFARYPTPCEVAMPCWLVLHRVGWFKPLIRIVI